jgi:hypothetical protein
MTKIDIEGFQIILPVTIEERQEKLADGEEKQIE